MTTENYVSFETAKLLKEKGFDGECDLFGRTDESELIIREAAKIAYEQGIDDECVILPTLQMAMKWLREAHNIHIAVIVAYHHVPRRYEAHIMNLENIDDFILHQQVDFASYEEACEAAIKYCLENLIY